MSCGLKLSKIHMPRCWPFQTGELFLLLRDFQSSLEPYFPIIGCYFYIAENKTRLNSLYIPPLFYPFF